MHYRSTPRTLVVAPGLASVELGLALLPTSSADDDDDGLYRADRPKRSRSGRSCETPAATIDPLQLGILRFQAATKDGEEAAAAAATDNRLPITLLNRRRRKRQKHRFDDAPEELSPPNKKKRKKKKTKKNKPRIIFLASDNEDEMEVGEEDGKGNGATNANHEMWPLKTTKQVNDDVQTNDRGNGEEDPVVETQASTSNKSLKVKITSINSETSTGAASAAPAARTTAETALRVVTPIQAEPTTTEPPQQSTQESSPSLATDEMEILQELFSKNYVGKPRKNRICPDSIFADAVQEVLQEDDDDSVGSGIGAGNGTTGSPPATTTAGEKGEGSVPLRDWFSAQRQQQQQQTAASTKTNETSSAVPNPRKASLRSFQHIPCGGYESFDMFNPEKMKERLQKQQQKQQQQQEEKQRSQPPLPRAPLDVSQCFQMPRMALEIEQNQPPEVIDLAGSSSSDDDDGRDAGALNPVEDVAPKESSGQDPIELDNNDDRVQARESDKAISRTNQACVKKVRQIKSKCAAGKKKVSDRRASIEERDDESNDEEIVDANIARSNVQDLTKEDEMKDQDHGKGRASIPNHIGAKKGKKDAQKRRRAKPPATSPELGDHHPKEAEVIVTDSSDSEGINFLFKKDSEVAKCERIAKDEEMAAELSKFRAISRLAKKSPYSLSTFLDLWLEAEKVLGCTAKAVEKSNEFRRANHNVEKHDSAEQGQAQYGRILPAAMEKVFREVMGLKPDSIFVDLGHGIGNTCLQAAYTIGCDSKGIELVDARYFASEAFHRCLAKVANKKRGSMPSQWNLRAGSIELKHGRLEDPRYHDWLTSDVHHVFVNNFAEVFGERSGPKKTTKKPAITVDSRIAAMFASMKPGSVMVTLHQIDALGLSQEAVLSHRQQHKLETKNMGYASFFNFQKIELGPANKTVSWSADGGKKGPIYVYKYTRLHQATKDEGAVFLCTNNTACQLAREERPIPATVNGESGLVMNTCRCKVTAIRTRQRGT